MAEYTPTPWEVQSYAGDEDGVCIIGLPLNGLVALATLFPTEIDAADPSRAKANAAFIVKAVNNHDAIVTALERLDLLLDFGDTPGSIWTFDDPTEIREAFKQAKSALAAVRKGEA